MTPTSPGQGHGSPGAAGERTAHSYGRYGSEQLWSARWTLQTLVWQRGQAQVALPQQLRS